MKLGELALEVGCFRGRHCPAARCCSFRSPALPVNPCVVAPPTSFINGNANQNPSGFGSCHEPGVRNPAGRGQPSLGAAATKGSKVHDVFAVCFD